MDARVARLVATLGGDPATVRLARAPGRVNLIGDHTDYNDGFCLPMSIDRDCLAGVRERPDGRIRAAALDTEDVTDFPVDGRRVDAGGGWAGFVSAAVEAVRAGGTPVGGVELAVTSTVPVGAGLSSSAALCVALVLGLVGEAADDAGRVALARAARDVEVRATGVPVGLMDQLVSVFGLPDAALLIDCRTLGRKPVPLPPAVAVGVVHSGQARALASSAYAERRGACAAAARRLGLSSLRDATLAQVIDDPIARHVVSENARVLDAATALREGEVERLGMLMAASHASLRDDFRVSTPEVDLLVELLVAAGAIGARLTGAGFGGCVVAVTARNRRDQVLGDASERFRVQTGLEPRAFPVRAVRGAETLPVR